MTAENEGVTRTVRKAPYAIRASCRSPRGVKLTHWAERGKLFGSLKTITGFDADLEASGYTARKITLVGQVVFVERHPWERTSLSAAAGEAWTYLAYAGHLAWGTPNPLDPERSPLVAVDIRVRQLPAYTENEAARS